MTYKYLTNNYVEWLGLVPFPMNVGQPTTVWVPENAAKPETSLYYHRAVKLDDHTYVQRSDGVAWDRLDTLPPLDEL